MSFVIHVVVVEGWKGGRADVEQGSPPDKMGLHLVFSENLLGQCSNGIGSDTVGACRFRLSSVARSLVAKGKEKKDRNAGSPNRGTGYGGHDTGARIRQPVVRSLKLNCGIDKGGQGGHGWISP